MATTVASVTVMFTVAVLVIIDPLVVVAIIVPAPPALPALDVEEIVPRKASIAF